MVFGFLLFSALVAGQGVGRVLAETGSSVSVNVTFPPTIGDNATLNIPTADPVQVQQTQSKVERQIAKLSSHLPYLKNLTYDLLDLYLKVRRRQVYHVASATRQIDNQIQGTLVLLATDDSRQDPKMRVDISYCTFANDYGVPEIMYNLRQGLLGELTNSSDAIFGPVLQNVTSGLRGVIFIKNFIKSMPDTMAICAEYMDQLGCLNDILILRSIYIPGPLVKFINEKMTEVTDFVDSQIALLGDNYRATITSSRAACKTVVDNVDMCINNSI